ncbi:DUF3089 domain-containing protein [Sphingosinicellaceae bacterium]|nr:DUF3089 domain-containing protein [Sphingosinicellaceae bacterium]
MIALLVLATATAAPVDYRQPGTWLCRPGRADACALDAARTVVSLTGTMRAETVKRDPAPKADCFYVYPTASLDPTPNSDMVAGVEERGQAASQFAAFGSVCRTFAPIYRQVTLTALRNALVAPATGAGNSLSRISGDWALAYGDVVAAWHDYLAHDNDGRPFVLIGHSQGSMMLKRLIAEEIDGKPVSARMVSAILPGTAVLVPKGKDVGGDFKALPLCRSDRQTGCIVTWASYRDSPPPPANGLFGRSPDPGLEAGCTNPARLGGGAAPLDGVFGFPWWVKGVVQYRQPATGWTVGGAPVPTRFARIPGLLSGECVTRGGVSYLAVHVDPGLAGGLGDQVAGPDTVGDAAYPEWGWHVMDITIAQADLVRLVARQTEAWRTARR